MRGFWGVGVYHPKHGVNVGTLFRSAVCFNAHFAFTVGRRYAKTNADTVNAPGVLPVYHHLTIDDLVAGLPHGCRLVGVELAEGAYSLLNYSHPRQACYLLGAEDHGLPPAVLDRCHEVVQIPFAKHCLNVATAGTVVAYDRLAKLATRPLAGAKRCTKSSMPV
jgi:tRNA G18 (ribose-2'-O)-methylase SpoU